MYMIFMVRPQVFLAGGYKFQLIDFSIVTEVCCNINILTELSQMYITHAGSVCGQLEEDNSSSLWTTKILYLNNLHQNTPFLILSIWHFKSHFAVKINNICP